MNTKSFAIPSLICITGSISLVSVAQEDSFFLDDAAPASTESQFNNEVELGLGYSSEDAFKFGEYSGLEESGAFAIGSFALSHRAAYDDESTDYWKVEGRNLGLDSRSLEAEYGQQGSFRVFVSYDQLPHFRYEDVRSPFISSGNADQTLPADWVAANTTSGMTNLFSNLQTFDIYNEREKLGGGFSWLFTTNWSLSGEYRHETKQGQDAIGAIFGTNGGNPRGALLLQPIDYETNQYDLALSYVGRQLQLSLSYYLSLFENNDPSLTWDNPFLRLPVGNTWAPGTDFAAGARGHMALDPDNTAQQIALSGGYTLGRSTRLTTHLAYGKMEQDETFLSYTSNPNLNVPTALPRNDLQGEIDTLYFNLGFSTRFSRRTSFRASYSYDERDNQTPRDIYLLVLNDSGNQGTLLSSNARVNTPYSFEKQQWEMEVSYRLSSRTKLSGGYEYEQIDRDFTEVKSTDEHAALIKLRSTLTSVLSGSIEYKRAQRDGSTYISNQPFLDAHNPDYIATLPADSRYINDPLLRKFNYADRTRDQFTATANLVPGYRLSFSVNAEYANNDYDESRLGLQQSTESNLTFDVSYSATDRFTTYAYLTGENRKTEQGGYQRAATELFPDIIRTPPLCGSCGFWNTEIDDDVFTVGTGFDWTVIRDKFDIEVDYSYLRSVTDISSSAEANVTFEDLPDITSRLHSLNITGEYQLEENMSLRLRYRYERFALEDYAFDNVEPDTMSFIIAPGNQNPDYAAHAVGISLQYLF